MSFGNSIFPGTLFFQGGLVTVTNGSVTVTGGINPLDSSFPVFTSAALEGDTIAVGSTRHYIKAIVSDTEVELTEPWSGASASNVAYTGAKQPWHIHDRALGYKFAKFLEQDSTTSAAARQAADDALESRNLAAAWASRPANTDVTTPGTRSALHYSSSASTSAIAAAASAVTAGSFAQLAARWAEAPDGEDVSGPGTRSAKAWAGIGAGHAATVAADKAIVAADKATVAGYRTEVFEARDISIDKAALAREWASKPAGQPVTGFTDQYSGLHWAVDARASAAAAAAIVFNNANMIDYGMITDVPTDYADYGTL